MICAQIRREFPDDPIVAEENPKELLKPERSESLQQVVDYLREDYPDIDRNKVIEWIGYGNGHTGQRFWTLDPIGKRRRDNLKKKQFSTVLKMEQKVLFDKINMLLLLL